MITKLKAMAIPEISPRPRMTGAPLKNCVMCKQDHKLEDCPEFKRKSCDDRVQIGWGNYVCYNRLTPDHRVRECKRRNIVKTVGESSNHYFIPHFQSE